MMTTHHNLAHRLGNWQDGTGRYILTRRVPKGGKAAYEAGWEAGVAKAPFPECPEVELTAHYRLRLEGWIAGLEAAGIPARCRD